MGCSDLVIEDATSFKSFCSYVKGSRMLKAGLAFSLMSYLVVLLFFFYYLSQGLLDDTVYTVDLQVFYDAGLMFLSSPSDIYSVAPNDLPFRYFPSFAMGMALFSFIPLHMLYVIAISAMVVTNVGIVFLVYRVSRQLGVTAETKNFEKTLAIAFITPPHIINLIFGQFTHLAVFLVLSVLYLLQLKDNEAYSKFFLIGILIGVAATLKPFFLVLLPFLVPITFSERYRPRIPLRQLVGVGIGFLVTMVPNIIYFMLYPNLVQEFLVVNFSEGLHSHHSTSVTKLIVNLVPLIDNLQFLLILMLVIGGYIFLRSIIEFVRTPTYQKDYTHHFTDMIFLVLIVYPDSWFLYLAVLYAFLAPSTLHLYSKMASKESSDSSLDFLWSGSNNILAFFSFGIVLHYLVLGFDPINPIWIVILYILYQRVYSKLKEQESSSLIDATRI